MRIKQGFGCATWEAVDGGPEVCDGVEHDTYKHTVEWQTGKGCAVTLPSFSTSQLSTPS